MSRRTRVSDFTKIHKDELQDYSKPGFRRAMVGFWWALDEDGYAYLFNGRAAQANMDKAVVEQVAPRTLHFANIHVEYIPIALLPEGID